MKKKKQRNILDDLLKKLPATTGRPEKTDIFPCTEVDYCVGCKTMVTLRVEITTSIPSTRVPTADAIGTRCGAGTKDEESIKVKNYYCSVCGTFVKSLDLHDEKTGDNTKNPPVHIKGFMSIPPEADLRQAEVRKNLYRHGLACHAEALGEGGSLDARL